MQHSGNAAYELNTTTDLLASTFLHIVVFLSNSTHLITLGEYGIGKSVQWKGSILIGRDCVRRQLYRAGGNDKDENGGR